MPSLLPLGDQSYRPTRFTAVIASIIQEPKEPRPWDAKIDGDRYNPKHAWVVRHEGLIDFQSFSHRYDQYDLVLKALCRDSLDYWPTPPLGSLASDSSTKLSKSTASNNWKSKSRAVLGRFLPGKKKMEEKGSEDESETNAAVEEDSVKDTLSQKTTAETKTPEDAIPEPKLSKKGLKRQSTARVEPAATKSWIDGLPSRESLRTSLSIADPVPDEHNEEQPPRKGSPTFEPPKQRPLGEEPKRPKIPRKPLPRKELPLDTLKPPPLPPRPLQKPQDEDEPPSGSLLEEKEEYSESKPPPLPPRPVPKPAEEPPAEKSTTTTSSSDSDSSSSMPSDMSSDEWWPVRPTSLSVSLFHLFHRDLVLFSR